MPGSFQPPGTVITTGRIPPESTSSNESLSLVKDWLENCAKSHEPCGPNIEGPLPSRVLDIGNAKSKQDGIIKLKESKNHRGRYACLSHCWGTSQPACMTATKTIAANKVGIPWKSFPKVFQDAITFTRKLGIPYLWIDSLCIVQDDKMDWHREAAEMATIYEHSVLTLAATDTRDGESSLFSKPRTAVYMGIEVLRSKEGDPSLEIYARRKTTRQHHLEIYPLLRRAWVYQERLLSPRMLHFTPTELM
jgi:hypothetical protein